MRPILTAGLWAGAFTLSSQAHAAALVVDCTAGPFLTIQSAVLASAPGDTIVVHRCSTGPYVENIQILGRNDLHFVGANAAGPANVGAYSTGVNTTALPPVVVSGASPTLPCFDIQTSSSISITGFTIQSCRIGVSVLASSHTKVHGNRIQNHDFAGYLESQGRFSSVTGNVIGFNDYGIYLEVTEDAHVAYNRVAFNSADGVLLAGDRLHVVNNQVQANDFNGINSVFGADHRIERNTCQANNLVAGPYGNVNVSSTSADVVGNRLFGSLILGTPADVSDNL